MGSFVSLDFLGRRLRTDIRTTSAPGPMWRYESARLHDEYLSLDQQRLAVSASGLGVRSLGRYLGPGRSTASP